MEGVTPSVRAICLIAGLAKGLFPMYASSNKNVVSFYIDKLIINRYEIMTNMAKLYVYFIV